MKIKCHVRAERKHCTENCERRLPCGHKCALKCRERCGLMPCKELVKLSGIRGLCGHNFVKVPCSEKKPQFDEETLRSLLTFCNAPCNGVLKCGDPCTSTCSECWQGRLHAPCQMSCGAVSICGHRYLELVMKKLEQCHL